jgi:hypothetical protein
MLSALCLLAIIDVFKLASMIVGHLVRDLLSVFSVDRIAKTARPVKGTLIRRPGFPDYLNLRLMSPAVTRPEPKSNCTGGSPDEAVVSTSALAGD